MTAAPVSSRVLDLHWPLSADVNCELDRTVKRRIDVDYDETAGHLKKIKVEAKRQGVAFDQVRDDGRHTIFQVGDVRFPISRQREISDVIARVIYQQVSEVLGRDWWR